MSRVLLLGWLFPWQQGVGKEGLVLGSQEEGVIVGFCDEKWAEKRREI